MPQFNLSSEADLPHHYIKDIQHFWQTQVTQSHFNSTDQVKIAYASAINPLSKKTVVVSTGRIEGLVKYKEVVFDLFNNGYSVFIHDHRGQGHSERLLSNPHKGYVESFDDYVEDFRQFMQQQVLPHTNQSGGAKPHLLCHSMGGAIGALYVIQNASDFDKIALSAPMFGIAAPLPQWVTHSLVNIGCALNRLFQSEPWYFLGLGDYKSEAFEKNVLTHSATRYDIFRKEYENHPDVQLGGPTFHWLQQAIIAMKKIEDNAHKIQNAGLILQAGADSVVDNKQQEEVAHQMPNTSFKIIEGAKHELLLESDKFRLPSINAILNHFGEEKS